jgi:DNA anti-recombination protein RmuC
MAEFADRMKSFTDHLRGSKQMRGEALSQVLAATEHLLDDARTFLGHVADEHQARAEELHANLTSHRTECRRKVAEMRQSHQDSLRKMRDDLHHTLSETRKARQDAVHEMTETFQHARFELASDLREASNAWREFASRAAVSGVQAECRAEATQPRPSDPEQSGRTSHRKPAHGKHAKARRT